MPVPSLTPQEVMNTDSFSQEYEVRLYTKQGLMAVEQSLFSRWLPKSPQSILDIGCGTGRTTAPLAALGHRVIGIDISAAMVAQAGVLYPAIDFRAMSATALEFPEAMFDAVLFSYNGLDYIYPETNRRQAIAEIRRVLKPGGLFIFSSHNSVLWPTDRYLLFWWVLNLFSGQVFTPYRLEYKQFRQGIKFIIFHRRPGRQIREVARQGFEWLDIFANPKRKHGGSFMGRTKNLTLITLFDPWPYFVFRKPAS